MAKDLIGKIATHGWLILRRGKDGNDEHLGIYESEDAAQQEIAILGSEWRAICLPLIGWAFFKDTGQLLDDTPISCPSHEVH